MSTYIIGLYVNKSFSLHIECLENVLINNQTTIRFVQFMFQRSPHQCQLSNNCYSDLCLFGCNN